MQYQINRTTKQILTTMKTTTYKVEIFETELCTNNKLLKTLENQTYEEAYQILLKYLTKYTRIAKTERVHIKMFYGGQITDCHYFYKIKGMSGYAINITDVNE